MASSEKVINEALNELHDLQHQLVELLKTAPGPKDDYNITKKAWIESFYLFKESKLK